MAEVNFRQLKAPLFIAWQLTNKCNVDCLHCCAESHNRLPDELTEEEIFELCRQIVELKVPYVAISGGEPLLHPSFFRIARFLRENGISLKVETNGIYIDREKAKEFARLNFRSVQVSIDGATPESYSKLRLKGDFHKVIQACQLLIEEGVRVEVVFVPTSFNIKETGQVIDMAASMGVYGFYTGKLMRVGRAAQNWDYLLPSPEDYQAFFQVLEEKSRQYDGRMKVFYYPYDVIEELRYRLSYPAASLLVLPNGKVKLIGTLPFICADLRGHSLQEAWQRYKKAWAEPGVRKFARQVIAHPELLGQANNWVELY